MRFALPFAPASEKPDRRPALVWLLVLGGALLFQLLWVTSYLSGGGDIRRTDFVVFFSTGRFIAAGHLASVYNLPALGRFERHLVWPAHIHNGVLPFVNPPFFAPLFAPLGALPYPAAYGIWLGFNAAALMAVGVWLVRRTGAGWVPALALAAAAAAALPSFMALIQGQSSIIVLGLLAASVCAFLDERWELGGILLALSLIKPQFAFPILLVLVMRRHWRAVAGFAATTTVLGAIGMVVFGPAACWSWLNILLESGRWQGYQPQLNYGLPSMLQLWFGHHLLWAITTFVAVGACLAGLALEAWPSRKQRVTGAGREQEPGMQLLLAEAVLVGLLISPHLLPHDLTIALLGLGLAAATLPRPRAAVLLTGAWLVFLAGEALVPVIHAQLPTLFLLGFTLSLWLRGRVEWSIRLPRPARTRGRALSA